MSATEVQALPRDPAFRCSPWTQEQGVDPIGSAPTFDALVLVEWPLPWPHDVSEIPALADASAVAGLRVMTVVPRQDHAGDGLLRVVHHRRTRLNHLEGVDHRLSVGPVQELLSTIAADPMADSGSLASAVGQAPSEVLVCGHGRRDSCCGRWGTLLHLELAARWTGVRVWRCSHTGGHRFAPTAITLPDGRAWAYADADLLDGVVSRSSKVSTLARHDRGSTAFDQWAQVLDRALLEHHGWAWLEQDAVDTATVVAADGRSARVTIKWPGGSAVGHVEVARQIPVLICGEPPDRATKTSPELALRDLRVT